MKRKFTANSRLINDLFTRYLNTYFAFSELLNNSIQASAENVWIDITYSKPSEVTDKVIKKIVVKDDGVGVHINDVKERLLNIGTANKVDGKGIGRFASLQIGKKVEIETIAYDSDDDTYSKINIPLEYSVFSSAQNIDEIEINTIEEILVGENYDTYYQVTITQLFDYVETGNSIRNKITAKFLKENLPLALFESYPMLIFNKKVNFHLNNNVINPSSFIDGDPTNKIIDYKDRKGVTHQIELNAIKLKSTLDKRKVFVTSTNAGVKTIVTGYEFDADWLNPQIGDWFVYLNIDTLPTNLFRNLDMGDLDPVVSHFRKHVKIIVSDFFRVRNQQYENFQDKLHSDKYYPYKKHNGRQKIISKTIVFDKLAYIVEEKYQVLQNDQKLREVVYPLIDRAIGNTDITEVLKSILKLSDDFIGKFRQIMDRADLEDLLLFNEKVVNKLQSISFLEKLIYTDISKHVKERTELHKILENMLWVFGEEYNDSTNLLSDKSLYKNLFDLRNKVMKTEISKKKNDNVIESVKGKSKSITDLFLYSEKIIDEDKKEVLIVELKAPRVKIGHKEIEQAQKYAYEIENQGSFSDQLHYTIILVSSDLNARGKQQFKGANKAFNHPYLFWKNENENISIWIVKWSDLFYNLKRKLNYMSKGLKIKDNSVLETIKEEFSTLELTKLRSHLKKVSVN
ncbi:ATP-binding protein [Aureibaculum conchae]|uniref:ATP-binding protein n=1 Tax=Aureibaculum sp. 2308TA14-22 TaxID=3108392 RepID=UPI0033907DD9